MTNAMSNGSGAGNLAWYGQHMMLAYRSLRWLIVIVAVAFLATLLLYRYFGGDTLPRNSISAYYHNQGRVFGLLPVRDLFVGMFASVAALLWVYKGISKWESGLLNGAAVGLLLVAVFPMEWAQPKATAHDAAESLAMDRERAAFIAGSEIPDATKEVADMLPGDIEQAERKAEYLSKNLPETPQDGWPKSWPGRLHYLGAFGFFFCIAIVCWCFRSSDSLAVTPQDAKLRWRYARLYELYALLMAGLPVSAAVLYLGPKVFADFPDFPSAVFWLEFAGVAVFIAYWWTKNYEFRQIDLALARHSEAR